jgi:FAD/FMN-containing dehydrogenase
MSGTGSKDLQPLFEYLTNVVGSANVLHTPDQADQIASFATDWTRRFVGSPRAVVRPGSTAETAVVVRALVDAGVAIVPQGGNTGLVGATMCDPGAVVLSTTRLTELGPVDGPAMQVSVGAGVTLGKLHAHVASAGLRFAVDLGARDSATIGGMIATNAGGTSVVRYGMMRAQVQGIEAVLPDGSIVRRMTGLLKDNTGFDFGAILAGSEGTLAVITSARLRLVTLDANMISVAIAVPSLAAGLQVVRCLQSSGIVIDAAEIVRRQGLEMMARHLGRAIPVEFGNQKVLLLNIAFGSGNETISAAVQLSLTSVVELLEAEYGYRTDPLVASTSRERHSLWEWRERHTEALSALGIPTKLDVSIPVDELDRFESDIDALVHAVSPESAVHVFGHIADGNLHVNVLGAGEREHAVEDAVLNDVLGRGGSVSAEHGIGRLKQPWLRAQRGDADVAAMRTIKAAFDPGNCMNPGVLFCDDHAVKNSPN